MSDTSYPTPATRRLRVYAFDPAASVSLDTAVINNAVIELPWEKDWEGELEPGPANDYLEVIDYDPGCDCFYEPVDVNHPSLLAQDGLPPSEGNPQFHQQMVFAVAMKTIRNFERALGRPVFWSIPGDDPRKGKQHHKHFTKRLRIYPHAMQDRNAFFSPGKGALLFGYFRGQARFAGHEGDWVFTCLSQDIVAHETTHAILHGMRRRNIEAANPDSLAFHEGFADIVALLQHFTMHQVVAHELARTGGVLRSVGLLTGLANQFGEATGCNGPLRSALDLLRDEQQAIDEKRVPKVATLQDAMEAHDRGQFLVAAVFDAFITIYERRTADLFEIADRQPGDQRLPDKLIDRLASEVAKIANSFLNICVRGLDYLPPGTTTFGDYLRAMITADIDLVPDDPLNYRVALAESFRKREIPVEGCMSYAPSALEWAVPDLSGFAELDDSQDPVQRDFSKRGPDLLFASALGKMKLFAQLSGNADEKADGELSPGRETAYFELPISARNLRDEAMRVVEHNQRILHEWLASPSPTLQQERMWEKLLGIRTLPLTANVGVGAMGQPRSIATKVPETAKPASQSKKRSPSNNKIDALLREAFGGRVPREIELPLFDVNSVRISRRIGPTGTELFQMFAQVTQRRAGFYDRRLQAAYDSGEKSLHDRDATGKKVRPDFWFRGGATIIVDLRNGSVQRVVSQRIDNDRRLDRQRDFVLGDDTALTMAGISANSDDGSAASAFAFEPFAFVHSDLS